MDGTGTIIERGEVSQMSYNGVRDCGLTSFSSTAEAVCPEAVLPHSYGKTHAYWLLWAIEMVVVQIHMLF